MNEIRTLSVEDLAALRKWFREFDADAWDREIEADALTRTLDALADRAMDRAISVHRAGKTTSL